MPIIISNYDDATYTTLLVPALGSLSHKILDRLSGNTQQRSSVYQE